MKCKRYQSRAPQKDFFWDRIDLGVGKNEDCLYLNIIAPGWKPQPEFVSDNLLILNKFNIIVFRGEIKYR